MKKETTKISLNVEKTKFEELKEVAEDKLIPLSVLVREGIDLVLERYKRTNE